MQERHGCYFRISAQPLKIDFVGLCQAGHEQKRYNKSNHDMVKEVTFFLMKF